MVSISTTREPYFDDEFGQSVPTAAARPAPCEPLTGFNPSAWAARRGDDAQSATFRALAWSDDDNSIADPVSFAAEEPRPTTAPTYRRSEVWFGIAAAVAAVVIGGLLFTMRQTPDGPTAIPVKVSQPAQNLVDAQPAAPLRPAAVGPKPDMQASGAPRAAVPEVVSPLAPAAEVPAAEVPAAEVPTPEVMEPEVTAPEDTAGQDTAGQDTAGQDTAPPLILITSPVPSIPDVTAQQIPRPAGPPVFPVPVVSAAEATPPLNVAPAAPVLPQPGLTAGSVPAVPPIIPTSAVGEGR